MYKRLGYFLYAILSTTGSKRVLKSGYLTSMANSILNKQYFANGQQLRKVINEYYSLSYNHTKCFGDYVLNRSFGH